MNDDEALREWQATGGATPSKEYVDDLVEWVNGNKRLEKILKDKPHLAEKVRQLRAKWLVQGYEAEHGEITEDEIAEIEGRKH